MVQSSSRERHTQQSWQWVTFCDPWVPWPTSPISQLTRDLWPSPRPWHESITTTYKSWWVHDYCLLISCNLEFSIRLMQYIVNLMVYTAVVTSLTRSTVLWLTSYTVYISPNHGSSVLRYCPVSYVTDSHLSTHLTHDPWPADPLSALIRRWKNITNHCTITKIEPNCSGLLKVQIINGPLHSYQKRNLWVKLTTAF